MPLHPMRLVTAASASLAVFVGTALADPASQASATPAASSIVNGTLLVNIVASNKSAIPTNTTVLCRASVSFFGKLVKFVNCNYVAKAQVTQTAIVCTIKIPYQVETLDIKSLTANIGAVVDDYGPLGANDPIPIYSYGEVFIPSSSFPLPSNGATVIKNITTVF